MNNRLLGTIALLCAPAMLLEMIANDTPIVVGTASMLFMLGSFCSHLGLWHLAATGKHWWGRGVLALQVTLIALAFLFGFFQATALIGEEQPLFMITDMAWPLSMLTMNLVSITAAGVGRLPGWRRFAILPCGLALPLAIVATIATGADMQSQGLTLFFFGMLAVFWSVLGWVVRQSEPTPATVPAPAQSVA